ncbi:MAG: hypothetical protein C0506_10055 [Anaerolinea sp.]|nr:hypothetical protein [Anaerolinea sp.]
MNLRRLVAAITVVCVAPFVAGTPAGASAAPSNPFPSASDTYYRLDVPNGTMSVTVELTIQNATGKEATTLPVYAMPGATNVVVMRDGVVLPTATSNAVFGQAQGTKEKVVLVAATLPAPVKANVKTDLVATYTVPAQKGDYLRLQPGAIETAFIGQGPGSFVFVDVPSAAETYFDPGCLKVSDQPKDVTSAGLERWVCGDVAVIALNSDKPDVLKRCADLDDKCRQRESISTFSAFVQSITDQSLRGRLETEIPLLEGNKTLAFGYFRRDQAWAEKQFAIAKQALPKLEALFGFPYPNGGTISMRQSHNIEQVGAAGIAFPDEGIVLLTPDTGFDAEVTVHELAHQWAGANLTDGWLWEGLAEYATRKVAPALGITPIDRRWQSFGHKDPLMTWYNGSLVYNPDYWYGKAGAFWTAYESAIGGPEHMVKVLAQTSPRNPRSPYDGRWFMDAGERVSTANLDSLFLEWVFNPATAASLVQDRRATYSGLNAMLARAAEMGLAGTPTDILDNLDAWSFGPVDAQVARASGLLDAYATVVRLTLEAGLPPSQGVPQSWATQPLAKTAGVVEEQRQALKVIQDSSRQFANDPEDSPGRKQIGQAAEAFAAGDFAEAKRLATSSLTSAYNQEAAGKMIGLAKKKQGEFRPGFLARVGMLMRDPSEDLDAAEQAYAAGDGARALQLSQSAYDAWDGAEARGLRILAILMGVMCALSGGVWLLLRRMDRTAQEAVARARGGRTGHVIEASESRSGWKDWENIP